MSYFVAVSFITRHVLHCYRWLLLYPSHTVWISHTFPYNNISYYTNISRSPVLQCYCLQTAEWKNNEWLSPLCTRKVTNTYFQHLINLWYALFERLSSHSFSCSHKQNITKQKSMRTSIERFCYSCVAYFDDLFKTNFYLSENWLYSQSLKNGRI